jgi:hypothetical protein
MPRLAPLEGLVVWPARAAHAQNVLGESAYQQWGTETELSSQAIAHSPFPQQRYPGMQVTMKKVHVPPTQLAPSQGFVVLPMQSLSWAQVVGACAAAGPTRDRNAMPLTMVAPMACNSWRRVAPRADARAMSSNRESSILAAFPDRRGRVDRPSALPLATLLIPLTRHTRRRPRVRP